MRDVGKEVKLICTGHAQQSLPSPNGQSIETVHYELFEDASSIGGVRFVVMEHDLFLQVIEQISSMRRLDERAARLYH